MRSVDARSVAAGTRRGANCICITQLRYYDMRGVDSDAVAKMQRGELSVSVRERDNFVDVQLNVRDVAPVRGVSQLHELFASHTGCVDIVLAPHVQEDGWLPWWLRSVDTCVPAQFQSAGVGYLRLADDMGHDGKSFLSATCGETFLDDEAEDD